MKTILTVILLSLGPADRAGLSALVRDAAAALGLSDSTLDSLGLGSVNTSPESVGTPPPARPIRHAIFEDNPPAPPR